MFALKVYEQPAAASVAENVSPAIVAVNVCCAVVVFGDAVTVTLPLPDPDAGATESAALEPEAVHAEGAHPDGVVVTFTTCDPPPEPKLADDGEIANAQEVFVEEGCVADGWADDPPQAASTTRIAKDAKEHMRLMGSQS